jgi:hypothetical protein
VFSFFGLLILFSAYNHCSLDLRPSQVPEDECYCISDTQFERASSLFTQVIQSPLSSVETKTVISRELLSVAVKTDLQSRIDLLKKQGIPLKDFAVHNNLAPFHLIKATTLFLKCFNPESLIPAKLPLVYLKNKAEYVQFLTQVFKSMQKERLIISINPCFIQEIQNEDDIIRNYLYLKQNYAPTFAVLNSTQDSKLISLQLTLSKQRKKIARLERKLNTQLFTQKNKPFNKRPTAKQASSNQNNTKNKFSEKNMPLQQIVQMDPMIGLLLTGLGYLWLAFFIIWLDHEIGTELLSRSLY